MGKVLNVQYHFKDKTAAWWAANDPVLGPAEPGVEIDTGNFKLGDGRKRWSELRYFTPVDPDGPADEELAAHINDPTPHPAYDEGPSLLLLYQNAKV